MSSRIIKKKPYPGLSRDGAWIELGKILQECGFEFLLWNKTHPFFKNLPAGIQQVEFRLESETKDALEIQRHRIIRVEIGELDPAKILRFEPMNHGRHRTAGASGETEKLDQLQSA